LILVKNLKLRKAIFKSLKTQYIWVVHQSQSQDFSQRKKVNNGYIDIKFLNQKPSILIDMDMTLNNINTEWTRLYNETYNDNVNPQNITDWYIQDFFTKCTTEQTFQLLETPELFSKMVKPSPNSIKVTEILSKFYELYIVTACTHECVISQKFEFTEKYFPHIYKTNVIICHNKHLIRGDYMIDDYIENLKAFTGGGKLLINCPHNLNVETPENIQRVDSWNDILYYFAYHNKELMDYLDIDILNNCGECYEQFDIRNMLGMKQMLNMKFNIQ